MSGWTCEPGQERYLAHLAATGALDEADRVFDAIDRGDQLGPGLTIDEVLARIAQLREVNVTPVEPDPDPVVPEDDNPDD